MPDEPLPEPVAPAALPSDNKILAKKLRGKKFLTRVVEAGLLSEFTLANEKLKAQRLGREAYEKGYIKLKQDWEPRLLEFESAKRQDDYDPDLRIVKQLTVLANKVDATKKASLEEAKQWARNHLLMRPARIDPDTAPCRYAVVLLVMATEDKGFRKELAKEPNKRTEGRSNGNATASAENGRLLRLAERMEEAVAQESAEATGSELGLSGYDDSGR